jgi:hypothetical protein
MRRGWTDPGEFLIAGFQNFSALAGFSTKCRRAKIGNSRSLLRAFPITEFLNQIAAGNRVKRQRVHIMFRRDVAAKAPTIGAQRVIG